MYKRRQTARSWISGLRVVANAAVLLMLIGNAIFLNAFQCLQKRVVNFSQNLYGVHLEVNNVNVLYTPKGAILMSHKFPRNAGDFRIVSFQSSKSFSFSVIVV